MDNDEIYKLVEQDIEETNEFIEVLDTAEYDIDADSAFPPLGEPNEELKHQLLNGKELPDQHPITAITGLRDELDSIEALQAVFSNEKNQADYYLWEDENPLQEMRSGLFVTLCNDTSKIRICTEADDIFGVTVDTAAFIGGQDDIARDYKYGLVVYSGIAIVQCELPVVAGDYVIPDNYGFAKKSLTGYGYKVFALEKVGDVIYAIISLGIPANIIHDLSNDVRVLGDRMDDAETNIAAAMNVANDAYNKSVEAGAASEDALKNATDALGKAEVSVGEMNKFLDETAPSISALAVQAKAVADAAAVSAEAIRGEAVQKSNEALAEVNGLIKDLEPITTWVDPESGNSGAEYLTTYIQNGLATKVEVQTVETKTDDNKSAIEHNAESINTIVSSVDKYSVGEYSQAYGLTREQAKDILKPGYIYIPTKNYDKCCDDHADVATHCETFLNDDEVNEFTPGDYYVWGINGQGNADWIEHSIGTVWIGEYAPANSSGQYKYWYINSSSAPEGYEAYALYLWQGETWLKVNTLAGNVNNRITSMIRQTADKIAIEVANAQDGVASHQQWLDNNSANIQDVVSWKSDVAGDVSQIATIKQTADDASASVSLVVEKKDGQDVINAASIVTAVNDSGSTVVIEADHLQLDGMVEFVNSSVEAVQKKAVYDVKVEYALSSSNTQAPTTGWSTTAPSWQEGQYMWQKTTTTKGDDTVASTTTCIQGAKGKDGASGDDGVSIKSTTVTYGVSTSATVRPTTWENSMPDVAAGSYLWTRTIIDYTDDEMADTVTYTYAKQGESGEDGYTPIKDVDYFDGSDGKDGTSIVWKGTYTTAPSDAQNGWAYYNSTSKASYVMQDGAWYQMSIDGVDGQDGANGISIVWKGESASAPTSPQVNWVYKDSDDGKVYIYNGSGWELMVLDGNDGQDGANGSDGLSVFITYHDGDAAPSAPTGNGDSDGWHTTATSSSVWMSQKVASNANEGTWGAPIKIKGQDGKDGKDGTGVNIKGTAYVNATIDDDVIGESYALYSDSDMTTQITNAADGDSYLASGYLFVYSGSGNLFTCAGKIQGPSGETPTVAIDENGYWVINGATSTIKAQGENGETPTVEINKDGYWVINNEVTTVKAEGDNGRGISAVVNYYMASSRGSGVVAGDAGELDDEQWTTDVKTADENKPYLWNYEVAVYTDGDSTATDAVVIGNYSKDGSNGADGKGIKLIEEFYCVRASSSQIGKPSEASLNAATNFASPVVVNKWYRTAPPTTNALKYLWNCERITYTDDSIETFVPALIGTHGTKGQDGTSISVYSIQYQAGESAINEPTGEWSDNVVAVPEGQYLWTKTTFSDGTVAYGVAKQGTSGSAGVSVKSVLPEYALSNSSSTVPSSDEWDGEFESLWDYAKDYQYIWYREKIIYSDNTATYTTARVDNASSVVASWCSDNDRTLINGGMIAANSITANKLDTNAITSLNYVENVTGSKLNLADGTFDSKDFKISSDGKIAATGGTIAGWTIAKRDPNSNTYSGGIYNDVSGYRVGIKTEDCGTGDYAFYVAQNPLDASTRNVIFGVQHDGKIMATKGDIGGWTIAARPTSGTSYSGGIYADHTIDGATYRVGMKLPTANETSPGGVSAFYVTKNPLNSSTRDNIFYVQNNGKLYAKNAEIEGKITATTGSFSRDITIEGVSLSEWIGSDGNVKKINATSGTVGGWNIDNITINDTDGALLYSGQALYSNEWMEDGATIRVAFTPKHVYVYGRDKYGDGVVHYASWLQIVENTYK